MNLLPERELYPCNIQRYTESELSEDHLLNECARNQEELRKVKDLAEQSGHMLQHEPFRVLSKEEVELLVEYCMHGIAVA